MKLFSVTINKCHKKRVSTKKFEDMIDILIAQERKSEKDIPWKDVKNKLKKAGKI